MTRWLHYLQSLQRGDIRSLPCVLLVPLLLWLLIVGAIWWFAIAFA